MAKKATESARLQDPRQMARDELDAKLLAARMAKILQCTTCRWRYTISRRPAYDTHRLTCGARTVNDTMEERISAALGTTGRTEETRCKDCEVYIIEVTSIRELQELNLTRLEELQTPHLHSLITQDSVVSIIDSQQRCTTYFIQRLLLDLSSLCFIKTLHHHYR
mmetsp:Transcript_42906/g.69016  ORF Transcript_42906/g.69016 Transcript_42906/m.69016 type:complete len:165 (+) Transcript_42906:254-748(+)